MTVLPSFTRASACFVFSGVIRFSSPRSSSLPQRPQFESSFSHCFSLSSVTSRAGSWVDGCGLNVCCPPWPITKACETNRAAPIAKAGRAVSLNMDECSLLCRSVLYQELVRIDRSFITRRLPQFLVRPAPFGDAYRPGARKHRRIIDCRFIDHVVSVDKREPLNDVRVVAVEIAGVRQTCSLDAPWCR